jgi:hypothetical protein
LALLGEKTEGRIQGEKRCRQVRDDFKETRGYWNLKEGAPDSTLWRTRFGRGYGPVVRKIGNEG